jgi:serine protease Do
MKYRVLSSSQSMLRIGSMALGLSLSIGHTALTAGEFNARQTPIVRAIQRAEPAVVNIQGNKTITNTVSGSVSKQEVNGMGTGVIIDPRGYIITNLHVVEDVARIEVTLTDGSTTIAKLINYDPETDLALIKVPSSRKLPTIHFGSSADLLRGETVVAIGNPFGYQNTVTQGIISALHRDIPVNGSQEYKNLIQTNADINPGNSGGPLLNLDGDVIGINVAVRVGAQGIGFAIPIDSALEVMADLVAAANKEPISHGLDLTRSYENGVSKLVIRDERNQETSSRTIRMCDVIENVNGIPVTNRLELELALLDQRAGNTVEIELNRGGNRIAESLTLKSAGAEVTEQNVARVAWEQLGIRVVPVPASAVTGLGEDYQGGLKITEVRSGSPAQKQRLVPGDIIVGIMEWQTANLQNLQWVLASPTFRVSPTAKYYVIRKRQQIMVAMTTESSVTR